MQLAQSWPPCWSSRVLPKGRPFAPVPHSFLRDLTNRKDVENKMCPGRSSGLRSHQKAGGAALPRIRTHSTCNKALSCEEGCSALDLTLRPECKGAPHHHSGFDACGRQAQEEGKCIHCQLAVIH
eukprot:217348-Pelagomonas_calceolata.AAC.5